MSKEKEVKKWQKPKCDNCSSSFGYPRLKKGEWVCRSCGTIKKLKAQVKK